MFLYETHMHTYPVSACAVSTPEEMVRHYNRIGFAGAIVTDHFFNGNSGVPHNLSWRDKVGFYSDAYYRAKCEGEKCSFDVFFGVEYSYHGKDFLLYGLSPDFLAENPGFDELELPRLSAVVRGAGGYIAQAHPFRTAPWILDTTPVDPALLDGFEVYNASMPEKTNKKALNYAKKHNLAMQAGSDAHDAHIRRPGGIALKKRAENIFDIINALKSGQVELIT